MLKKKLIKASLLLGAGLASVVGMGAFEAHVINVRAKIENALAVSPREIDFGTVFPQEYLTYNIDVRLSDSFMEEDRVDDVEYYIKQKPKPRTPEDMEWCHNEENYPEDSGDPNDPYYERCYPDLGKYLSLKLEDMEEPNRDVDVTQLSAANGVFGASAFHDNPLMAVGHLSKKRGNTDDRWVVDLPVPCFGSLGDMCAQDWPTFYDQHNGEAGAEDAWEWTLDPRMEHEVFGTDLWVEVYGISVNYIDRIDFGNPESEAGLLDPIEGDWSYIGSESCTTEECLRIGGYGDYDPSDQSHDFRGLMGAPTGCQATGPSHAAARFRLDVGMGSGPKTLVLRHLDGSQDDSFDVYANGNLIGHYDWQDEPENWVTTEWDITGYTSLVDFELVATDPDTPWCEEGWGQVMFNWAEVREEVPNGVVLE